jgi:hypothetical protein
MKSLTQRKRRLELEQMEDRRVMAGFVQAAISGGDLVITGDWAQNEIVIYKGANANQVVVSGLETGNGPTRVNGKLLPVTLNGFTGSIVGNMNEGSDKVLLTNLNVPRSVVLNTQKGNDQVALSNGFALPFGTLNNGAAVPVGTASVHDSVVVNLGDGSDTLLIADTDVGDDVVAYGEAGNDNLNVVGSRLNDYPRIADNMLFFPGTGDDTVFTDFLKVGGFLEVHDTQATSGSTVVISQTTVNKDLNVFTSQYNDFVSVRARVGNFNAFTYGGNDSLFIQLPASLYNYINTGAGDDSLFVADSVATIFTVDTGDGNDSVLAANVVTDRVYTYLGSGNDSIGVQNSTVKKSAHIHGGTGKNTFTDFGGNNITGLNRFDI